MRHDKLFELLVILALCFAIGAYVIAVAAFVRMRLDAEAGRSTNHTNATNEADGFRLISGELSWP